jgi:C-terminal processing protease CtpA/Prc
VGKYDITDLILDVRNNGGGIVNNVELLHGLLFPHTMYPHHSEIQVSFFFFLFFAF